ncbi:MAG: hypothetical protein IPN55_07490 [Saprospiraceae bacterium]|nr:hypothetical protein [Candidatus Brachybacter algidus]
MNDQFSHDSIEQYITNIYGDGDIDFNQKNAALDALYKNLMSFVTDAFKIPFNTIFSQVAFCLQSFEVGRTVGAGISFLQD